MNPVTWFVYVVVAAAVALPFLKGRMQKALLLVAISWMAVVSSVPAWGALTGESLQWLLPGNGVTGEIPLRLDALSAWFILIINLVFITGGIYGLFYLESHKAGRNTLTLHFVSFLLLHASMLCLTVVQNSLVFIILWEIMTVTAFLAIIFEHEKWVTLKAGINFLIQSHVSLLLLMTGFLYGAIKTGSYDFAALAALPGGTGAATALMILFIAGFGIKAGFVPFHTWLPHAHPAAPAHISGIMSGVIIKIGIFGILRMLLLLPVDYSVIGILLLVLSLVSGVYGVMLAIVQHNLKKLLAYHSIENIGIIGMGIGLGAIGMGSGNMAVASLGFAGALLHTLNHALFKSLLFYTAGNVYQATHTLHIEHLGGVMKKMPLTALLFLVAAIAICGIPPFNGFISEFLVYSGLYTWMQEASLVVLVIIIFTILGLVLIGGLALLCFTKAFGIVFLGTPRRKEEHPIHEVSRGTLAPLWVLALMIVLIGSFPHFFTDFLGRPVALFMSPVFAGAGAVAPVPAPVQEILKPVALAAWGVIVVSLLLWGVRHLVTRKSRQEISPTWSCGYVAPTPKLQYTAGSFARSYTKLFKAVLTFSRREKGAELIFPIGGHYESHASDKVEQWLIDKPVSGFQWVMSRFLFLQNGKLQVYILYGILFVVAVIILPLLYGWLADMVQFLKQM